MLSLPPLLVALALTAPGDLELLEFTATWCSPCQEMQPTIEQVRSQGYTIRPIDIDQQRDLAQQLQVTRVPTFILVSGRQVLDRLEGSASADQLIAMFQRNVGAVTASNPPPPSPPPPAGRASSPRTESVEQLALKASVRLRIEDAQGHSYGTGTIVDVHGQEALVLTCGHIFRDSAGKGRILVDLFVPGAGQPVPGHLISYTLDPDIALVAIHSEVPLTAVKVAGSNYRVAPQTPVFSVGCNHGQAPTVMRGQVKAINKYLGPPNLVTSGRPVDGRSGGGLFSADGVLVGICNAADPEIDEGLYAAYPAIHRQLDAANLSFIYQGVAQPTMLAGEAPRIDSQVRPAAFLAEDSPTSGPRKAGESPAIDSAAVPEILILIRSPNDPNSPYQVLKLDRPSPEFVQRLHQERLRQGNPQMTGMHVSSPRPVSTPTQAHPR